MESRDLCVKYIFQEGTLHSDFISAMGSREYQIHHSILMGFTELGFGDLELTAV